MMKNGFVKVHRALFASRYWRQDRKFSPFEALMDLLRSAYFGQIPIVRCVKGRTVQVGYGELIASLSFMATRWDWSIKAVRTFLRHLQEDGLARVDIRGQITVINVTPCFTEEGPRRAPAAPNPAAQRAAQPAHNPAYTDRHRAYAARYGAQPAGHEPFAAQNSDFTNFNTLFSDYYGAIIAQQSAAREQTPDELYPSVAPALQGASGCVAQSARGAAGGSGGELLFGGPQAASVQAETDWDPLL